MKTTNPIGIIGRILLQAMLPVILFELAVFVIFKHVSPESTLQECIHFMHDTKIVLIGDLTAIIIVVFGCWFHFISKYRFINRRPKGLYKEYIAWFLEPNKYE